MEPSWVSVQQKTFTKWLNSKLQTREVAVNDLVKDLSDGVMLIHLLEILGNESLGRYAANPRLRVQRFENVNKALSFIRARGIQMTNIGAEDVVDGNRKIILGLIWTLILRFTISDISEEGMTAKEGLLLWCQRKTACYEEVDVRDFSASWNDGLAFCALLDIHRPDLIDYDSLDKSDHRGNMQRAFDIAAREIGIPALLDVEDVCDVARPDERSLMTYIAYWFHAFSQMERVENAGRRVEKFVQNMQGAWAMQNSFERRMRELLRHMAAQRRAWADARFAGTYADAKAQAAAFAAYKRADKRAWVAEKADLVGLLGNIRTKLSTYRLRPYEPPAELSLERLEHEWAGLMTAERERSQLINETIRDIKDRLRRSFADRANDFTLTLSTLSAALSGLEGEVEDQLRHVQRLRDEALPPLAAFLDTIAELDARCAEARIEENDYTTYTLDELRYEFGLVQSGVAKKHAFLENQLVARSMTNLTPIQLEEFESVFRHFDRGLRNALSEIEFRAALASLGLVYDEHEMRSVFRQATTGGSGSGGGGSSYSNSNSSGGGGGGGSGDFVTFEQFIRFMVDVTEDQNTAEQVFQSFREVADGKPYVTELDLRHSLVPEDVIDQLKQSLPVLYDPAAAADDAASSCSSYSASSSAAAAAALSDDGNASSAASSRASSIIASPAALSPSCSPGTISDPHFHALAQQQQHHHHDPTHKTNFNQQPFGHLPEDNSQPQQQLQQQQQEDGLNHQQLHPTYQLNSNNNNNNHGHSHHGHQRHHSHHHSHHHHHHHQHQHSHGQEKRRASHQEGDAGVPRYDYVAFMDAFIGGTARRGGIGTAAAAATAASTTTSTTAAGGAATGATAGWAGARVAGGGSGGGGGGGGGGCGGGGGDGSLGLGLGGLGGGLGGRR